MKRLLILLLLISTQILLAQTKIVSWNIENLGKSKTETELQFIAQTLKNFDIIAIQEVVAGYGGSQAVAKLVAYLNRSGQKWDYSISNPTTGSTYKRERYAYIWNISKTKQIKHAWLDQKYHKEIEREPYLATFMIDKKNITLVSYHAITKSQQPEREIKYLRHFPNQYPNDNLIFLGDFNCTERHSVFKPLKEMGYSAVFKNTKTTLKRETKDGSNLASEFDNIFYPRNKIKPINSGVIYFHKQLKSLKKAREISDHLPIWVEI